MGTVVSIIDTQLLLQSLPALFSGAIVTLEIAALSCAIGLSLGTIIGIAHGSKSIVIRAIVGFYTTIIRGTPQLIQVLFAAYAIPLLFGISIPYFWCAVIALGLNSAAYISQIIRSGIASVDKGQIEAARVLGLSKAQTMRSIILPQAIQVVLPALGNEFITLVKDSSLASLIGVVELANVGRLIISKHYDAITAYTGVGLAYLVITTTLSFLLHLMEQRMNYRAEH